MSFIFDAKETPDQRAARKSKAVMGALQAGAMQQPTDLGSGIAALGNALAYRRMQGKPSADAQGGNSPLMKLRGLFGFGG